jgi:hypothetical protein
MSINSEALEPAQDCSSVDEDFDSVSGTSTSGSTKATDKHGDGIKDKLSRQETEAVLRLRVVVIVALLLAAAAVSCVVYFVTSSAELEEFEILYEGTAEKVVASFTDIVEEMGAISGLGVAATSHSLELKQKWPFATLSDFQQRAGNARTLSGSLYVSVSPIVYTKEDLIKWEVYVLSENNYW